MIHYHGTPITPRSKLLEMQGRHFCVSFADPRDLETCLKTGQSLMMDNGAFTAYTKGKPMDKKGFYAWCDEYLCHPNWAVIPDVIGGSEEEQKNYAKDWPFPKELSSPVWHERCNRIASRCGAYIDQPLKAKGASMCMSSGTEFMIYQRWMVFLN